MKRVLMLRSGKSYLPQIEASIHYFNERNIGIQLVDSAKAEGAAIHEFDGVWKFAGIDCYEKLTIPLIHEYASLSTGLFPEWKNKLKKTISFKPDLRIYLNSFVHEGFSFHDHVDYVYRDMGVDDVFFNYQDSAKHYDCVYVGAISKQRGINRLLDYFKQNEKKGSLLLVGKVTDDLYKEYTACKNIIFTGDLAYKDVAKHASEAVYGVNYMPDKYPYNLQTATKLLEYIAMGLNVITTNYFWVQHFMEQHEVTFITVDESLADLDFPQNHEQGSMDIDQFRWSNVIKKSGLEEKLRFILL